MSFLECISWSDLELDQWDQLTTDEWADLPVDCNSVIIGSVAESFPRITMTVCQVGV